MKHTFYYGNIFNGDNIVDAITLQDVINIRDGTALDPLSVGEILEEKKPILHKALKEPVNLNVIDYPEGYQYFDVHFIRGDGEQKSEYDDESTVLPPELSDIWSRYERRKEQLTLDMQRSVESSKEGHWLSEDKKLRSYEEYFVENVPRHYASLVKILQSSKDENARRIAAYLLQWHQDKGSVAEALLHALGEDPFVGVQNEAGRALYAISGVVEIPKEKLMLLPTLLYKPSSLVINKALALLSKFLNMGTLEFEDIVDWRKRIGMLADVKQPAIKTQAKGILRLRPDGVLQSFRQASSLSA